MGVLAMAGRQRRNRWRSPTWRRTPRAIPASPADTLIRTCACVPRTRAERVRASIRFKLTLS